MPLHQTIKEEITKALRAKNTVRLDTLRGLNALIQNEMLANSSGVSGEFLTDDKVLALVKRSVKQRKDSIEQFKKGGRQDLVKKEEAELKILESFMPAMMSRDEIRMIVQSKIEKLKAEGNFNQAGPSIGGKLIGVIMKELAGKADGADVKAVIDDLLTK